MFGPLLSYRIHTMRLCALAIASALLAPLCLVLLPQGVEVLRTLDDTTLLHPLQYPDEFVRVCAFAVALGLWCLANWYGARLLLQRHFGLPIAVQFTPQAAWWRKWLPRGLVLAGTLPIALKLLQLGQPAVAALVAAVGAAAFGFAVYRRRLAAMLGWSGQAVRMRIGAQPAGAMRHDIPEGEELALYLAACFAAVLLAGLAHANYGIARAVGAAAILLLALAAIGLGLNVLLVYLPKAAGWPAMTGAAVLAAVVFGSVGLTANHGIAERRVEADAQTRVLRPAAREHWRDWWRAPTTPKDGPIFLVAAEGGASRSAWWTGHVLGALDDATDGDFGRRVFAASGVSGGSLGLATWVALRRDLADGARSAAHGGLDARPPRHEQCEQLRPGTTPQSMTAHSACFLGGDFVSTTLGYMLGVDLLQRVVPAPMTAWDRSRGLEATWLRDWRGLFGSDHFGRPFMSLYKPPAGAPTALRTDLPLLLLNTTSADQGRPVVQSPVQLPDPEVDDLFDPALRTAGMTLATAVHNSARFPYVSPAGDVLTARGDYYDAVVDGGYVENSGALALGALMRAMAPDNPADAEWQAFRRRLVVLFIANDPDEPVRHGAALCDRRPRPLDLRPRSSWGEAATPPVGLFMVRSGRAEMSRRALLRELNLCDAAPASRDPCEAARHRAAYFVSMASPRIREVRPAMSWYMTPDSRDTMWRAVATEPALSEMRRLLQHWAECTRRDAQPSLARLAKLGD